MSTTSYPVVNEPQKKPLCLTKETKTYQEQAGQPYFGKINKTKTDWIKMSQESDDVNLSISESSQLFKTFDHDNELTNIKTCKSGSFRRTVYSKRYFL